MFLVVHDRTRLPVNVIEPVLAATAASITIVSGAAQYRRSTRVPTYQEVMPPLVQSAREYCLVLRPFGSDGRIILRSDAKSIEARHFRLNVTLEQLVAAAARDALRVDSYGIVDQKTVLAPPGVRFMRAPDTDWQRVVQRLIRRAHSIVLIIPPGHEVGGGFAWEIEQIVRFGRQARVVVVLPPPGRDRAGHQQALDEAAGVLARLAGQDFALEPDALLVKCAESGGVQWWHVDRARRRWRFIPLPRRTVVTGSTYLPGLVEAFRTTESELAGRPFEARYA